MGPWQSSGARSANAGRDPRSDARRCRDRAPRRLDVRHTSRSLSSARRASRAHGESMSGEMALGPGAEFDAIRSMIEQWGTRAVALGDDAAELKVARGDTLVVSVDTAVEGIHFRREWLSPKEIAYRAVTAALSDIAAMAAKPLGVLTAITLPQRWRASLDDLASGIADAVDAANTVIRGGNLSDGAELAIATTVLGSAYRPV